MKGRGAAALVLALLLESCAGGGGGGAGIPFSGDIRPLGPGLYWTFSISGNVTFLSTGKTYPITGQMKISVLGTFTSPTAHVPCLELDYSGSLSGTGFNWPYLDKELVYQDSQSNLWLCGSYNYVTKQFVFVTMPSAGLAAWFVSPMATAQGGAFNAQFDDGGARDDAWTVGAVESVSGGRAFRVQDSSDRKPSDGTTRLCAGDVWFSPPVGNTLRRQLSCRWTDSTGRFTDTETWVLQSYG